MDWDQIKRAIYFRDGSLRDIYVLRTTIDDWKIWIDFINRNYPVRFFDRRVAYHNNQIDIGKVKEFWDRTNEEGVYAEIFVGSVMLRCYFNDEHTIENDFSPRDINSVNDHNSLMAYLIQTSHSLNKHAIVTNEMKEQEVLIDVFLDSILYS
jgi:hypothetical protein